MRQPKQLGLTRLALSFVHSWRGYKAAFKAEQAFRGEVLLVLALIPLGIYFGDTGVERALLVATVILVLIVEPLNTGIEAVVDRIGTELHELSGRAKDVGSAAVLSSITLLLVVWGFVLLS